MSQVRDRSLAPSGRRKIDWVSRRMPVLSGLRDELSATRPLAGVPVAVCCHLEAKTAFLAEALAAAGAEVAVAGSNPLSTQDDVAAALAEAGIAVYAWRGATNEEYVAFLHRVLDHRPALIMDDGGDLIALAHTDRRDALPSVCGGSEETTTGIQRLLAMERQGVLAFPVMATNNARMKHLFDNRYGTGQSVWDGIMRTTNLLVAGKTVVVAGYGWCGKGVARRAAGLGAQVIVTEVDPVLASEALMDGFRVLRMQEAAPLGDIFVTVTGTRDVIGRDHLAQMKDGAILANAGHFDVEISKPDLRSLSRTSQTVRPNVEAFELEDGRRLYLLAEGRLVNLAAGDGHPAEIMDLSFAVQMLALLYVHRAAPSLGRRVVPIGPEIDQEVARRHLSALGVHIDELTPEQAAYRASWLVE